MSIKRIALLFLIILPFVLGIILLFRDSVRDLILVPILYLFWLIGQLISSLDQKYIWYSLILVIFIILIRSIFSRLPGFSRKITSEPGSTPSGRIQFWESQIQRLAGGNYAPEYSLAELRKLIVQVVAQQERLSMREAEQFLISEEKRIPHEVQAIFRSDAKAIHPQSLQFTDQLKQRWLTLTDGHTIPLPPTLESEIRAIIRFMESELEGSHD
jgi:hypothetical protein